jgi:GH24 family phage-related lysozyme (muramidase)
MAVYGTPQAAIFGFSIRLFWRGDFATRCVRTILKRCSTHLKPGATTMANQPQSTGAGGLALIKSFEGLRLEKYKDAVGKWTIGYGHLILPDEKFPHAITEAEAEALLRTDLLMTERGVHKAVTVALNQNQFDALVAFTFNLGAGNLQSSTLLKLLNQGEYAQAADQFLRWNKAGGKVLAGLTRRREAERALFLKPV